MKKLSLVLMLIGISGFVFLGQADAAPWTQNGDLLYNTTQTSQVGIGTTSPISRLHVEGNYGANLFKVRNYLGQTELTLSNNGYLGLGTWDPQFRLDIVDGDIGIDMDGHIYFENEDSLYVGGIWMDTSNNLVINNTYGAIGFSILAQTTFAVQTDFTIWNKALDDAPTDGTVYCKDGVLTRTNPSSRDYKTDIKPLDLQAERVLRLEPKSFNWKNGHKDFGYIAEEVREAVPELYLDDGRTKGYAEAKLSFYIIEVLKDQQAEIAGLKTEINTLKARLETVK